MRDRARRRSKDAGLPPGTLAFSGERRAEKVEIALIDYDKERAERREVGNVEDCFPFKDAPTVTWINIDGLHVVDVIEALGAHFGVHPLVLEDVLHTEQRPKLEDYGDYLFLVLRMITYNDAKLEIESEQISLILGPGWVISFQEREGDVFDPVRQRIFTGKGRIRKMGADYLAYSLMDTVVDHYFLILERLGERIETLEGQLVQEPTEATLGSLHKLKREMIELRRSVWPLREIASGLQRVESRLVRKDTHVFLRDLYDHTIQVIDTVEGYRDMTSGMIDLYLSSMSQRMNEIMKVLTVIATIFIPLTFVASIYGMNFQFMPELLLPWFYPLVLATMAVIAGVMVIYFRRRGWL